MAEADGAGHPVTHTRWTTKRMFFSVLGIGTGTVMLYLGKLDGANWVFLALGCIAGHHAEDLIKAWKGGQ